MADLSRLVPGRRSHRFSWLGLLLVLSLTLNLCAVAGYLWSLSTNPGPRTLEHHIAVALSRVGIDPASSPDFQTWKQQVETAQKAMAKTAHPLFDQIWTEMAQPSPDQDHIHELIDRITANRRDFETALTAATIGYLHTLDAPKRQALVETLKTERNGHHPRD